ncbi:MAG: hypothetical protein J7L69_11195, partial [Desulfobulbaceae bacterium]|nr:hypothetical protein [Desulfobulbaceae bacterium]
TKPYHTRQMNKIFAYLIGAFCILIILLKIIFAAFFPEKFSGGQGMYCLLIPGKKPYFLLKARTTQMKRTSTRNGTTGYSDSNDQ